MKTNANSNLVTVIEFARLANKRPQQIYGGIRNGSFPDEFVHNIPNADGRLQPMVDKEKAYAWIVERDAARAAKLLKGETAAPVYSIDQLLADLTAEGKKGLATQVANFLKAKGAAAE